MPHFTRQGVEHTIAHFNREAKKAEAAGNKKLTGKAIRIKKHYQYILKRMGNQDSITLPASVFK